MIKKIKRFFYLIYWSFTKEGIEAQRIQMKQQNCKHEKWNMDINIRIIECCECNKRAWVDDYKNLYEKK